MPDNVIACNQSDDLVIGIDATNLRQGGGRTHLIELLRVANPVVQGIRQVIVWGGNETLSLVDDKPWLTKITPPALNKGLLARTLWQRYSLSSAARSAGCNILFVPGGSYSGNFKPVVTMSQNLLPFEMKELMRYGWSFLTLKLLLLRLVQSRSFIQSEGVIFLSKYASLITQKVTGNINNHQVIIPHGFNPRFINKVKDQLDISNYSENKPYHILYVSIVDEYKHQWVVVEGVDKLRKEGFPVVLDLIGPAYAPALEKLDSVIDKLDKNRKWVKYHGAISFDDLHYYYAQSDLGLFASSCENLPNILIETMAAGLPIACSNKGPMPEVLGDAGLYFDPEKHEEIFDAIKKLIESPELRESLAKKSFENVQQYSWERCADETFGFLYNIAANAK